MSKIKFNTYQGDEVTKELLDSIKYGDFIKVNDWGKWHKVMGVVDDYFVVTCNMFGKEYYSVCEKLPWRGTRHNEMIGGKFHMGTAKMKGVLPKYIVTKEDYGVDFDDQENCILYLKTFELGNMNPDKSEITPRNSIPINIIHIRKG